MKRALVLLALVASGAALADVSGHRWFNTPVAFKVAATVDNDGSTNLIRGNINYSGSVIPAIQTYFHTWTKAQVTGTTWDSTYSGTFTTPAAAACLNASDGQNSVVFLSGTNWHESSATLGLTLTSYITATGEIVDADMEFNNSTIQWDDTGSVSQTYDYPSVILHEAGHFLGLNHSSSSLTVMYYAVAYQEVKRALAAQDISDVQATYPVTLGGQGTTCNPTQPNCSAGLVCRTASGGTSYICTADCTSGGNCPTGYTCQTANSGKACLPQLSAPDLCKFCTSGGDCSTGTCVTDGAGHNWCSNSCTTSSDCGTGYTCVSSGSGNLCAPALPWGPGSCPNQCTGTGTSTCPLGYVCSNGSCNPTGNAGDRCEVAGWCQSCLVCVGTTMQANCRPCCGGAQYCMGCMAANCGTSATCTGLTSGDSVCIPTTQSNTCQACSGNTCPSGEICTAGACHTTCNPSAPGTCTACFDSGGGNGICACPNEVASLGQQCGLVGSGFFACQTGLACVGTPPTCLRQCDTSNPNSCNTGEMCQQMGNVAVCMPGTIGTQCAACGTNNACATGLTCNSGRCYPPCNTSAGVCSSCVALSSNGDGVCACPDQVGGVGSACGSNPIGACATGALCIDGLCRGECDLGNPGTCGILEECQLYPANAPLGSYCLPINTSTGGGGGSSTGGGGSSSGGGGGSHGVGGGGGGGTTSDNTGCSCGADGVGGVWALLGMLGFALRRRRP